MKLIIEKDLAKFDDFVLSFSPNSSIMQTSRWAMVKDDDWKPHYLMFEKDNKIVASAMLLERKAFLSYSFFYCSRGFMLDYNDESILKEVLELTKDYVKKHRGFVLRFDPEVPLYRKDCRTLEILEDNTQTFNTIKKYAKSTGLKLDFGSTLQPRFQMLVNLKDGDLKTKIKSKKRRLVNETYLEKRGYQIVEMTNEVGIKEFSRLSKITEVRQGISLRNEAYFMKMYHAFNESNNIKIYMAQVNLDELLELNKDDEKEYQRLKELQTKHGNIVNTNAIICIYGTPIVQMFYGASDDDFAKYKAGYKMHFQAMEDAQKDGYDYFNLGGVPGTLDDGLFRFKSEFHPELFEYMGDFDVVINGFINVFFDKGVSLLKRVRGLFKR